MGNVEIGTRLDPATDIEKFKSFINKEVVWIDDDIFKQLEVEVTSSKQNTMRAKILVGLRASMNIKTKNFSFVGSELLLHLQIFKGPTLNL